MKLNRKRLHYLKNKWLYGWRPETFMRKEFRHFIGYDPNMDDPKSYSEKIMWLKLYWNDPIVPVWADKDGMRKLVENAGFGEHLNEVYGVWDDPKKINFDALPDKFALKSTHASGDYILCTDKSKLDRKKAVSQMREWLSYNFYYMHFEWVYKHIRPQIICERFIEPVDGMAPWDYKIYCFGGEPRQIMVRSWRAGDEKTYKDFYDTYWVHQDCQTNGIYHPGGIPRPAQLEKMLEMSRRLSKDFPHVRVDLYIEGERILIGELTFFSGAGVRRFEPAEWDMTYGSWLTLPRRS